MKRSVVLLLAFLTVAALAGNAQATFPGSNGRIAFYDFFAVFGPPGRVGQIFSIKPDGSDMTRLTTDPRRDKMDPAWSADGAKIVFAANAPVDPGRGRVVVMDGDGSNRQVIAAFDRDRYVLEPAWSPDGTQVAFCATRGGNRAGIWVVEVDGSNLTRISSNTRNECFPDWSPDGSRIAFTKFTRTGSALATMTPNGSDRERLVTGGRNLWPSWSPNGAMITFSRFVPSSGSQYDVFLVDVATGSLTAITDSPGRDEYTPCFSPDGLQIAYSRANGGVAGDIWIVDVDGSNRTKVTDTPARQEFKLSWQAI